MALSALAPELRFQQGSELRLRAYQERLLEQIDAAFGKHASIVLQLPTGGGKTHIGAAFARSEADKGERIWFICHRREIIRQTVAALNEWGVDHGVIAPTFAYEPDKAVQVGSVDLLRRHVDAYPAPTRIIWDECHHIVAKTWSMLRARFAEAKHLGLTATPSRLDGQGLGRWFDDLIGGPDTRWLIEWGYLSNYRLFAPSVPDLRGAKLNYGEYPKALVGERMSDHALVGDVIDHYKRKAPGRSALLFAISVSASQTIVDRFNAAGIRAEHVDGGTPTPQRDDAIRKLASGEISILSNVDVFTEGFDLPEIGAVILLRPTKSFALYRQMIGRGLRRDARSDDTIILDHAGLIYEHGLPDDFVQWSLGGNDGRRAHGVMSRKTRICPECDAVHEIGPVCPDCGYRYTGHERTIEEIFGELTEIRRRPGWATPGQFAKLAGLTKKRVDVLRGKGMPHDRESGMIHIKSALEWIEAEHPKDEIGKAPWGSKPGEYENKQDFAARIGFSVGGLEKLFKKGMPRASNGWIPVKEGQRWFDEYVKQSSARGLSTTTLPAGFDISEYETQRAFSERIGKAQSTICKWAKEGLPTAPNGWVHIERGLRWVRENKHSNPAAVFGQEAERFAELVGWPAVTIRTLMGRGLPMIDGERIDDAAAAQWIKKTPIVWTGLTTPNGFTTRKGFAASLGHKSATYLIRLGIPTEVNGLVNIKKAEQWWRELKQ